jgi:hypothetical protein
VNLCAKPEKTLELGDSARSNAPNLALMALSSTLPEKKPEKTHFGSDLLFTSRPHSRIIELKSWSSNIF